MRREFVIRAALVLAIGAAVDTAAAQMFGPRTLGRPLSRRPAPGADDAGVVTGNERFLRGARSARNFVGADPRDIRRFVGEQLGTVQGDVTPAASELRELGRNSNVNRPTGDTANQRNVPYRPRLRIAFDYPRAADAQVITTLNRRLGALSEARNQGPIEVTVEGSTAILRGQVDSEHYRVVAEQLVRLEPGIDQVQNELTVTAASAAPPSAADQAPDQAPR